MTSEDHKLLQAAWADRKWPAHLTYEQIVAQWKHEREMRCMDQSRLRRALAQEYEDRTSV